MMRDVLQSACDALRAGCAYVALDVARARVVIERAGDGARVIARLGDVLGAASCDEVTVEAVAEALDEALTIAEIDVSQEGRRWKWF